MHAYSVSAVSALALQAVSASSSGWLALLGTALIIFGVVLLILVDAPRRAMRALRTFAQERKERGSASFGTTDSTSQGPADAPIEREPVAAVVTASGLGAPPGPRAGDAPVPTQRTSPSSNSDPAAAPPPPPVIRPAQREPAAAPQGLWLTPPAQTRAEEKVRP
jgi:hypothetical protein